MGYRAHPPSPLLADIGKDRFGRFRRAAVLEQLQDQGWVPVGRYRSVRSADEALDEMIAGGSHPDRLRVTEEPVRVGAWVALVVGIGAIAAAIWLIVSVLAAS